MSDAKEVLSKLESMRNEKNIEGMKRFGIRGEKLLGISVYDIKRIAREMERNHGIANDLWESGIHEARMLAAFTDEIDKVTEKQLEKWVMDFDSWDICDQTCGYLFDKTPWAYDKAFEWSKREEEFVKRAGFVLMATLSVHDKKANDGKFEQFFPVIRREAHDERNFVKKAVNWALRQIGKRNIALNGKAVKVGEELEKMNSKAARWIAKDALRELRSGKTLERLGKKEKE
jgi:3-methyladenine DNA glycosylase AlkD